MKYYIADLHFFHERVNGALDRRGFTDLDQMHEHMIEKWNGRVRARDEVYVLGDLSFGKGEETNALLSRLKGKIYLIEGNHDCRYLNDKAFDRSRFEWVKGYAEVREGGRLAVLCHYPIMCYNGQYRVNERGEATAFMLHGHVHGTRDQAFIDAYRAGVEGRTVVTASGEERHLPCNIINCFCMYSDYVPLTLQEWISLDARRRG